MTQSPLSEQALKRKRRKRQRKFWFLQHIVVPPLWWLVQLYFKSWRIDAEERRLVLDAIERESPLPVVFWHTHLILANGVLYRFRKGFRTRFSILLSPSKDGDLVAGILHSQGHTTVRGSSSKSAVRSLVALRKEIERCQSLCIPVDGPQGPRGVPKEGVVLLTKAQKNTTALLLFFHAKNCKFLGSWDKTMIPPPFAKVSVQFDLIQQEAGETRESFLARLQWVGLQRMQQAGQPIEDIPRLSAEAPETVSATHKKESTP